LGVVEGLVSLHPAIQDILPDNAGGRCVELVAVDFVVTVDHYLSFPLNGDATIVELVPSNLSLGDEQVAVCLWVVFQLSIDGFVLPDGLEALPVELR